MWWYWGIKCSNTEGNEVPSTECIEGSNAVGMRVLNTSIGSHHTAGPCGPGYGSDTEAVVRVRSTL